MGAAGSDVVVRRSRYGFAETLDRLTSRIAAHGGRVFAVIDHAAGAADAGLQMPPTTVVIFGNPAVGTPLMLHAPDLALDLPSRVLVRQAGGEVQVVHTPAGVLAARYGIPAQAAAGLAGLAGIVDEALAD